VQASTMSKVGKAFDAEATAAIHSLDARITALEPVVPPPPPPPVTTIAPPQAPITTVANAPGLGLNVTTVQLVHDLVVDGCGDTAVLFQLAAAGSSLKRARLSRVAALNSVNYGKHGIYGKVRGLLIEDLVCVCSSFAASGVSFRYDGAVMRRFNISGAPHALTYYEESTTKGTVLFEDGDCSFRGDTAVWMDTNSAGPIVQAFTFRRMNMTGAAGTAFMKVQAGVFSGASVRLEGCTLNGRPVTAADLPNVPNVTII